MPSYFRAFVEHLKSLDALPGGTQCDIRIEDWCNISVNPTGLKNVVNIYGQKGVRELINPPFERDGGYHFEIGTSS